MNATRSRAVTAGVLYLITHVTSVVAVPLYARGFGGAGVVSGGGPDSSIVVAGFLEAVLALACVGTAVTLYPVIRSWGPGLALGHVGLRVLEAAAILTGVAAALAVVSLRHSSGDPTTLDAVGAALVALRARTFWLGPNFVLPISTLLLATVLYRSRLVHRAIPVLGLVGGATLTVSSVAILFGAIDQVSVWGGIAAAPAFAWELSLALWLIIKGFRTGTSEPTRTLPAEVRVA